MAFTNVNVILIDKERVLQNQTALVKNGIIAKIGNQVNIPKDAQLIAAKGKYLIPGLADMHLHIFEEDELLWYIANRITKVRVGLQFAPHNVQRNCRQ